MANPFLKLASGGKQPSNPAREKLAVAIAEHEGVLAGINDSYRRESAIMDRRIEARRILEAAEEAAGQFLHTSQFSGYTAEMSPRVAAQTVPKNFRQAVIDAQEIIDELFQETAREVEHREGLERRKRWTQASLNTALQEVVSSDPAVKELCDRFMANFREHVDMRRALQYLHTQHCLPMHENMHGLHEQTWAELPGDRPWRAALEGLRTDADTPLPEIK